MAAVILPMLYGIIRYAPPEGFLLLVAGGILIGQYEFYRLYYPQGYLPKIITGLLLGFLLPLNFYLNPEGGFVRTPALPLTLIMMATGLFFLLTVGETKKALIDAAVMSFGILYVSLLLSHLILLRHLEAGVLLVLFVMGITWLCDAGAYYAGRLMGRHSLAPRISPNKTVEGAIGGLVFAILGSLAAIHWFLPSLQVMDALAVGLLLGVFGQAGDLVESLWKRSAGVKDSGRLLFAHGGFLDKMDSLIFTVPVFYYYMVFVKGWPVAAFGQ